MQVAVYGQARKPEARNIVSRKATPHDLRRPLIGDGCGSQTVEAEYSVVGIIDRKEGFRAALRVALARIPAQEIVQVVVAAIKGVPIVHLTDRLFMPGRSRHTDCGRALAAVNSLALGAGGFSSRSSTRRLSRSDSFRCSAS